MQELLSNTQVLSLKDSKKTTIETIELFLTLISSNCSVVWERLEWNLKTKDKILISPLLAQENTKQTQLYINVTHLSYE